MIFDIIRFLSNHAVFEADEKGETSDKKGRGLKRHIMAALHEFNYNAYYAKYTAVLLASAH